MKKAYTETTVLVETRKRIAMLFDEFEEISVSVSGGKDSTVLYYLVLQEAMKRNRKFYAFFLDQEAEYKATIDIIKIQMNNKYVIPEWYQIPIMMFNATSAEEMFLYAWGEGEEWIREKNPLSIQEADKDCPKRFYELFPYLEKKNPKRAFLVGLRADESLTRFRATTKNTGYKNIRWSTKSNDSFKFYPIYDWGVFDIWKFMYDYNVPYNKIYDLMFKSNKYSIWKNMRVSNLIHSQAYKSLIDLPRFEPETFNKLCKRISGISTAQRYASEKLVFSNKLLPKHYKTWLEFRDFLLLNHPLEDRRIKFTKMFERHAKNEKTYQKQVGLLLINDYQTNTVFNNKENEKKQILINKWLEEIL